MVNPFSGLLKVAGTVAGVAAAPFTGGASLWLPAAIGGGAMLGSAYLNNRSQSKANKAQMSSSQYAADLEAKAAADALAFAKLQEEARQREFRDTTAKNLELADRDFNLGVSRYNEQQQRLRPFQQLGTASVAQLGRPMPRGAQSIRELVVR